MLNVRQFYESQGVSITGTSGKELVGTCPFCEKEKHFYIGPDGPYYCQHCNEKGNHVTLLEQRGIQGGDIGAELRKYGLDNGNGKWSTPTNRPTPNKEAIPTEHVIDPTILEKCKISESRLKAFANGRGLPVEILNKYQLGWDGHAFTLPVWTPDGILTDIRRRPPMGKEVSKKKAKLGIFAIDNLLQNETVYVAEGCCDAMMLESKGLPAIGICGTGHLPRSYAKLFEGKTAVFVYDADEPGRQGVLTDAAKIQSHANEIKSVDMTPYASGQEGFDVSDFFKNGGTVEKFKEILAKATPVELEDTTQDEPVVSPIGQGTLTHAGNARRIVELYGKDIRYCHAWNTWLVWNGTRWARDAAGQMMEYAEATARTFYVDASEASDPDTAKTIASHAGKSLSTGNMKSSLEKAQSIPGIPVMPELFDTDPYLLNCLNGTLDLRNGELRPHSRDDLITKLAPVKYEPEARCPLWLRFLGEIFNQNGAIIDFLHRAIGYSLTGVTSEQCLFILYGIGQNGKSVFLETTQAILGDDYARATPTETILFRDQRAIPNDVARLAGVRMVTINEVDEGRRMAESLVKQMTGCDTMTARFLNAEFFDFKPQFKLFIRANHKPVIRGTDFAIWRRIRLIPFEVAIPESEQDKHLPDKLRAELSGILAWAVRGCMDWQRHDDLGKPEEVVTATQEYQDEMDVLGSFIDECCHVGDCFNASAKSLYEAYQDSSGDKNMSQQAFGRRLTERGFERKRSSETGRIVWHGIGLLNDSE